MIPVTDAIRSRTFPFVNIAIIVACTIVFVYELSLSALGLHIFYEDWALQPHELYEWWKHPEGIGEPSTVFTAAFLHGGWLHLGGNMLFLWVFGDNVEDALGHVKYAAFYVVAAAGAAITEVAFDTNSVVPVVGASGAIAGVLAGYLVLYPKARVGVATPLLLFFGTIQIPAFVLIGFWFALQLVTGIMTIGDTSVSSGVAVWAHVGGFITGFVVMIAARPFIPSKALSPPRKRGPVHMW